MGSERRYAAEVHALIMEGLRSVRGGDLNAALLSWERALERDPSSRAARMLVDLTEAYFEAVATGIEFPRPDFRSHLEQIGYDFATGSVSEVGRGRAEGAGAKAPSGGAPSRQRQTHLGGPQLAVEQKGQRARPPEASEGRGSVRRTMYGLPLRDRAAADSGVGPVGEAEDSDADTTPPGMPAVSGTPRYRAEPPPPASHRRRGASDRGGTGSGGPAGGMAPGSRRRPDDSEGRDDPWADLGFELAGVPSNEWKLPGASSVSDASQPVSRPGAVDVATGTAPAWDATEGEDPGPSPAPDSPRVTPAGPAAVPDDLPEPLKDPFAILDRLPEGGKTAPVSREKTPTGMRFMPPDDVSLRRTRPNGSGSERARASDLDPALLDLFEDLDEDLLPPPVMDPLDLGDLDLDDSLVGRSKRQPRAPATESEAAPSAPGGRARYGFRQAESGPVPPPSEPPADAVTALDRQSLWERARQEHSLGDFSAAERLLKEILSTHPDDEEALRLLEQNRLHRERSHLSRLRSMEATPRLALGQEQLVWQNLDAKKGFVLSRIDGRSTVRDIIDLVNLPHEETIQILAQLVDEGILAIG